MFTLSDHKPNQTCQGLGRRDFLKAGALGGLGLGLGNLTLPGLLEAKAKAMAQGKPMRNKSVVLLFCKAAPHTSNSSIPKCPPLRIPQHQRGNPHHHSGAHFRFHLSQVGQDDGQVGRRSFLPIEKRGPHLFESHQRRQSDEGRHERVATRIGGAFDKKSGMPNNCLVLPEAIDENLKLGSNFETGALPGLTDPGTLGSTYSAFNPAGGGTAKENMELRIAPDRLADRKGLLGGLDGSSATSMRTVRSKEPITFVSKLSTP